MNINKTSNNMYTKIIILSQFFLMMIFITLSLSTKAYASDSDFLIKNGILIRYTGDSEHVIIPDTVTSIGDEAFYLNNLMKSILIPDSVTSIGNYAFADCSNLKSISIPTSVISIGDGAFSACSDLSNITLPDSVTSLGEFAFIDCITLINITIPNNLTDFGWGAFYSTPWLEDMQHENSLVIINQVLIDGSTSIGTVTIPDNVKIIGDYAFFKNTSITDVVLPSSVITINQSAFSLCSKLENINLPKSIESIEDGAFSSCSSLHSIILPNKITKIGPSVFSGCRSLTSIKLSDSIVIIGKDAFSGCSNLVNIKLPPYITSISNSTFSSCTSITSLEIPGFVTSIDNSAFSGCTNLENITIPNSVTSFGAEAFENTAWLDSKRKESPFVIVNHILIDAAECTGKITVPKGVVEIGKYAFYNSSVRELKLQEGVLKINEYAFHAINLNKVTLPDGLIEIGNNAFRGSYIKQISIPDSVKTIGAYAFYDCDQLHSVIIPDGVVSLGDCSFADCDNIINIFIPKTVTSIGDSAFAADNSMVDIHVSPNNIVFSAQDAFLMSRYKNELLCSAKSTGEIIIPEGVEIVKEGTFSNSQITKVLFPSTLKILEDNVFYSCNSLTEIILPSSLISFGNQRFYGCPKLNTITVGKANGLYNFTSNEGALYKDGEATLVCNPATGSIVVPNYVTTIESYAFPNVDVSVLIPASVTTLGENIFVNELYEWTPADEEPLHIYGYTKSAIDIYCKVTDWGVKFLAYDAIYNIRYNLDGGINSAANPASFHYESNKIKLQSPTKEGYLFLYWYEDVYLYGDGYSIGENKLISIPNHSLGDIEVTAKWKKVSVNKATIRSVKKTAPTKIQLKMNGAEDITGYEIVFAKDRNFTSGYKRLISHSNKVLLEKLSKGTTYYIKIRAFQLDSTGKKVFGKYSSIKKITL